jgi:hypothetical protein
MKKRTWFVLGLMATVAVTTVGACGYVKVLSGSGDNKVEWGDSGYQAVTEDSGTPEDTDQAAVDAVAASLDATDIVYAEGDSATSVTASFTVPTTMDGCAIVWTASDGSVVTIENGVATVTRPSTATDATITLTATITKGSATATKTIDVVVKHQVTDAEAVAACKATLSTSNLTFTSPDTDSAVTKDFTLPATISDCDVAWSSGTPAVVAVSGTAADVTRPAMGSANAAVTLTATMTRNGNGSGTKELGVTVVAYDDVAYVQACADSLTTSKVTYAAGQGYATIKSNITLPTTVLGDAGSCNVSWTSSSAGSTLSTAGAATRPNNGTAAAPVTLTATVSRAGGSSTTKALGFTVLAWTDADEVAADTAALTITYGAGDATCATQSASCVTNSVTLATSGSVRGSTITWESSDTNHIGDSVTGTLGQVTRGHTPGATATDTLVTLTATITKGTAHDHLIIYNLRVKPWGTINITSVNVLASAGASNTIPVSGTNRTDSDGTHVVSYRVCVALTGSTDLDSIASMTTAADTSPSTCSTDEGSPRVLGTSVTACCTATSITSTIYFQVPSGAELWRSRIFAQVSGDPNEDHHKVFYNKSGEVNPSN